MHSQQPQQNGKEKENCQTYFSFLHISNLFFYAQSTVTVISGQKKKEEAEEEETKKNKRKRHQVRF